MINIQLKTLQFIEVKSLFTFKRFLLIFRYDKWDEYHKEIEDMNVGVENFTVSLKINILVF